MRNLQLLLLVSITASGCGIFGPSAPPSVQVDAVQSHTNQATVAITGSTGADGGDATIEIIGGQAIVTGNASGEGKFSVSVRLRANQINNLSVVGFHDAGSRSSASSVNIIHDNIAPGPLVLDLPRYTNQNPFLVTGISEAGVSVSAATATVTNQATAAATGAFSVSVALTANSSNQITLGTTDVAQNSGSPTVVNVIQDAVAPALTTSQPATPADGDTPQEFDTDGDSRVNIAFSFSDSVSKNLNGLGGIDVATVSATNDRAIGGGTALGGYDAGTNILQPFNGDFTVIDTVNVTYNAALDHEFPVGTNTLILSVADSAGNIKSDTVSFEVYGTEPSFNISSPLNGQAPPFDELVIQTEFSDVAGRINEESGVTFVADKKLTGLLTQEGTKQADIEAGESFGHLFESTSTAASYRAKPSDGLATHSFPAGEMIVVGQVADRAGNLSIPDTVSFIHPTYPHTVLVVNSTAAPGAADHVVPIGLTSFETFSGLQFTVGFPAGDMVVDSVKSTGRVSFNPFYEVSVNGDAGSVEIVLVDLEGNSVPDGSDVALHIYTSVSGGTQTSTDLALVISDATASNAVGNSVAVATQNGILRIR